jgi:hypothetical protein
MEKHERFSEIRKGLAPKNLANRYSGIAKLILSMTDIDMNKRPTAKVVVRAIQAEIMRLEGNTLGLGVCDVLTQRSRFYSYDEKDRQQVFTGRNSTEEQNEDSYTLVIDDMSEYSELGNNSKNIFGNKPNVLI